MVKKRKRKVQKPKIKSDKYNPSVERAVSVKNGRVKIYERKPGKQKIRVIKLVKKIKTKPSSSGSYTGVKVELGDIRSAYDLGFGRKLLESQYGGNKKNVNNRFW